MHFYISNIQKILNAETVQIPNPNAPIEMIALDSRRLAFPQLSLFIAISGKQNDAHAHLREAYDAGIRNFIVSKKADYQYFENANFLYVENSLWALQQLATFYRAQFSALKVVGITGSNGKTVVKEWLFQLLRSEKNIVRSPKSYNSQTGVPLSIFQILPSHNLAIFEAGISQIGEMENLANMIAPKFGIFTMIGDAHAEGFTDVEQKIEEKIKLFLHQNPAIEGIVLCADQPLVNQIFEKHFKKNKLFRWTKKSLSSRLSSSALLRVLQIHTLKNESKIEIILKNKQHYYFNIPFTDHASVDNALTCLTAILAFKLSDEPIETVLKRMSQLEPVEMRLQLKAGVENALLINDTYNSDLHSLTVALDFAVQQGANRRRTLILSDILQSGTTQQNLYATVATLIVEKNIQKIIGIGTEIAHLATLMRPPQYRNVEQHFFAKTEDFLQQIRNSDFRDELILVKGARQFGFERIVERLSQKAHNTTLQVDLNALARNFQVFKQLATENYTKPVRLMAMVKAAAYGNGAAETAQLLAFQKADYLAVAYTDEGIALREAGAKLPIMVLNPDAASFDAMLRHDLEPEIYSLSMLQHFSDFAKGKMATIHLKMDTGMHRLGFEMKDIEHLKAIFQANPNLKVASVFTHLVAAENPLHDDFTHAQVQKYEAMYQQIAELLRKNGQNLLPLRHVLNSSGIVRFPQYRLDMVRLGIGLYGIDGSEMLPAPLEVVQTLTATISQIKELAAGETVGYSRRGSLVRASRIATISIGYADGLPRLAGLGRFSVWLHGKFAPIVGSVCMDMTMVDVTDIEAAKEGDTVEIFGKNQAVQVLASALGTIPYEVFTHISERVKRVYLQE